MYKLDLHTHSEASADGGLSLNQYQDLLSKGVVDYVAITDHNQIDFALKAQSELGNQVIVGEEIMTLAGEIIGLYLKHLVPAGLSAAETVANIKAQGGLVYIPHPFETVRHGLHPAELETIQDSVDIIEVCNGRAWLQNRSSQAVVWSKLNKVVGAASSDAHGIRGCGRTYTTIKAKPTKDNLLELLKTGTAVTDRPGIRALLYPKVNRIRNKFKG